MNQKEIFQKFLMYLYKISSHIKDLFIKIRNFRKSKNETLKSNILIKYLCKDLFLYFLVCFAFFFMIFFVNQILLTVEQLLSKSAPFKSVMRIMFYSLPFIIAQSAPYATLVGFLMSLGSMMSNNEILIFRASGFSFFKILIPVLAMGMVISVASFFVNDYLLPLGTIKYNKLYREIMQSTPTIQLESDSVLQLDKSFIVTGKVSDNSVSDLIMFDSKSNQDRIIIAGKSSLSGGTEEGVLMELQMSDTSVVSLDIKNRQNYDLLESKKTKFNVFDATILGNTNRSAREMTTYDLLKNINEMKNQSESSARGKNRLNLWIMEFHKKFSIPFGSIFFAFLAFSVAFLFGKHNGQTIGLFVGIVICVLNWAMQIMGQLFVQRVGLDPFICIWLPNFVVTVLGFGFFLVLIKK